MLFAHFFDPHSIRNDVMEKEKEKKKEQKGVESVEALGWIF